MGRRLLMVVALRWTPSRASLLRIGLGRIPDRGQEPVRPFLREPARVGEDHLDLGVADLKAGQDVGQPCSGDVLQLEQTGVAALHHHGGQGELGQALHLEGERPVRERGGQVL
jgi:hypothetical protein